MADNPLTILAQQQQATNQFFQGLNSGLRTAAQMRLNTQQQQINAAETVFNARERNRVNTQNIRSAEIADDIRQKDEARRADQYQYEVSRRAFDEETDRLRQESAQVALDSVRRREREQAADSYISAISEPLRNEALDKYHQTGDKRYLEQYLRSKNQAASLIAQGEDQQKAFQDSFIEGYNPEGPPDTNFDRDVARLLNEMGDETGANAYIAENDPGKIAQKRGNLVAGLTGTATDRARALGTPGLTDDDVTTFFKAEGDYNAARSMLKILNEQLVAAREAGNQPLAQAIGQKIIAQNEKMEQAILSLTPDGEQGGVPSPAQPESPGAVPPRGIGDNTSTPEEIAAAAAAQENGENAPEFTLSNTAEESAGEDPLDPLRTDKFEKIKGAKKELIESFSVPDPDDPNKVATNIPREVVAAIGSINIPKHALDRSTFLGADGGNDPNYVGVGTIDDIGVRAVWEQMDRVINQIPKDRLFAWFNKYYDNGNIGNAQPVKTFTAFGSGGGGGGGTTAPVTAKSFADKVKKGNGNINDVRRALTDTMTWLVVDAFDNANKR